jgi:uncharacterized membrane protein
VIYGLVAALGWGSTDFLGAISGRRMGSLPALAVSQLAGTCVAVVLFVVHGEGLSPVDGLLGFVVANGLIAMTAYALHYRDLSRSSHRSVPGMRSSGSRSRCCSSTSIRVRRRSSAA